MPLWLQKWQAGKTLLLAGMEFSFVRQRPAWKVFTDVVQKYRKFDLLDANHLWFAHRVAEKFFCQGLNQLEEVRNREDWLSIEHRKKGRQAAQIHRYHIIT